MTQKNSENIYKALKEEERTLLEKNVTWMEKAFKRKEGYVTFGNAGGELVFCEGEFLSYLEGFQTIILKDGKQIAAYNWKIEDGIKNFQVLCSMKTDKSGKIFFCLIIRGDAPIIVGHTEEIEQESQYNLLIHAWDTETGYIWVGDNRDDGLTRIDYLISGNGVDTYSELSGDISVDINHYEIGEMPASTKEYYLSYGNDFDTAWLNAMYTDVYVYSGKYSNLDAWDQFTQYIAFYDEVVDYDNERAPAPELYDVYYAYDPDTEKEAGQCVDEVIRIAEESGAEIQFY